MAIKRLFSWRNSLYPFESSIDVQTLVGVGDVTGEGGLTPFLSLKNVAGLDALALAFNPEGGLQG